MDVADILAVSKGYAMWHSQTGTFTMRRSKGKIMPLALPLTNREGLTMSSRMIEKSRAVTTRIWSLPG